MSCCVCLGGGDHACPGWCLRHGSLAACTANEDGLEAHIASRELRHPTDLFSELGEGLQVPGPVLSTSFSFLDHRHLKYPPANLEKFSFQGTDIQSEDNGSLAARKWLRVSCTCGSDIFINTLSDILNAKQGMGAKRARINCRRSLVLCKASPQDMCTLEL